MHSRVFATPQSLQIITTIKKKIFILLVIVVVVVAVVIIILIFLCSFQGSILFLVSVLLSAHVERFSVSRMHDFQDKHQIVVQIRTPEQYSVYNVQCTVALLDYDSSAPLMTDCYCTVVYCSLLYCTVLYCIVFCSSVTSW